MRIFSKELRGIHLLLIGLLMTAAAGDLRGQDGDTKTIMRTSSTPARRALVIGNGAYKNATPLPCAVKDARDMASTLKTLGFTVQQYTDATQEDMETAIRAFGRDVKPGDVAMFYYSGHGVQIRGLNYLVPIGMDAHSEDEIKYKAVPAEMVLDKLEQSQSTVNLIVLDACRSNPFKRFKSLNQGLAQMNAPTGTLIAYATAPGTVALGAEEGENSPYTKHLLKNMKKPDFEVGRLFRVVRAAVLEETHRQQVPWESVSLVGDFYFVTSPARVASTPAPPSETRRQVTATFTVREGDEKGPLLPGAKLELLWRETPGGEAVVLGSATSDTQGRAAISAWLDGKQQAKGDFLVLVSSAGGTQPWSLPGFPKSTGWNLYASVLRPAPPPTMPRIETQNQPVVTNSIGMKLVLIPAGKFQMGSPDSDADALGGEKPQHPVQITEPFYLGATEVTQEQYEHLMGENPSSFEADPQRPVEQVSWDDAVEFCKRLSQQEGKTYRLPTEAQWEYACRAGSTAKWHFGDEESRLGDYAWYRSNSDETTHPVGQKKANAWGLYDMHGNVNEWCADWYDVVYYRESPTENPTGPAGPVPGLRRVYRGGSWLAGAGFCRAGYRYNFESGGPTSYRGFRVSLVPAE